MLSCTDTPTILASSTRYTLNLNPDLHYLLSLRRFLCTFLSCPIHLTNSTVTTIVPFRDAIGGDLCFLLLSISQIPFLSFRHQKQTSAAPPSPPMLTAGASFFAPLAPSIPPTRFFPALSGTPPFVLTELNRPKPDAPALFLGELLAASALWPADAAVGLVMRSRKLPVAGLLDAAPDEPLGAGGRAVLPDTFLPAAFAGSVARLVRLLAGLCTAGDDDDEEPAVA